MSGLMTGKRGLIMGVANDKSIAYGIAKAVAEAGAELAFTYQNDMMAKRVLPLAEGLGSTITMPNDVSVDGAADQVVKTLKQHWDRVDFVVHALAFADKAALTGAYMDVNRQAFLDSMLISAFSFTEIARAIRPMMTDGGSMITLTYLGANRITPNYNVMGVAKAALEASVRYLAVDLGRDRIRVNGLSAGPVKTLAGAAIGGARHVFRHSETHAPLGRNPDMHEVGRAGLYLTSDLSSGVTGEIHYVDGGYHHIGVPRDE
ncbi:MAG: enoyl-ACP reductase [Alphaproteobacteria bacterium]|jgi:enoyl-[acyl-carrier protein] reductase I|nr:enoyl-ACP reductase [Alphaproteobacteria bacterium]